MRTVSSRVSGDSERLRELQDSAVRPAPRRSEHRLRLSKATWYAGYELGMAFCRLTEQLANQPGSKIDKEIRGLECALRADPSQRFATESVNVVDLGTGDGRKASAVIAALLESGVRSVRYVPVDTNPHISRYAIFTILGGGKREWTQREAEAVFGPLSGEHLSAAEIDDASAISVERLVRLATFTSMKSQLTVQRDVTVPAAGLKVDFMRELSKVVASRSAFMAEGTNLFCLLGNTLGNWSADERRAFLCSLSSEMRAGDQFLLGVSLRPPGSRTTLAQALALEREHSPAEVFMRLGADEQDSKFCVRYDQASSCMTYGFERSDISVQDMGYSYLFDCDKLVADLGAVGLVVQRCQSYPRLTDGVAEGDGPIEPRYLTVLAEKGSADDGGCR